MSNNIEVVRSIKSLPENATAVVALGKQFGICSRYPDILADPDHLSTDSRITVRACGLIVLARLSQNQEVRLLFSGSSAGLFPQAAVNYMAKNFPEVPTSWYELPDERSVTTQDSAIRVPQILEAEGHSKAIIATVDYHANRTVKNFSSSTKPGLFSCLVATNFIVAENSKEEAKLMAEWARSPRVRAENVKESVALILETGAVGRLIDALVKARRPSL